MRRKRRGNRLVAESKVWKESCEPWIWLFVPRVLPARRISNDRKGADGEDLEGQMRLRMYCCCCCCCCHHGSVCSADDDVLARFPVACRVELVDSPRAIRHLGNLEVFEMQTQRFSPRPASCKHRQSRKQRFATWQGQGRVILQSQAALREARRIEPTGLLMVGGEVLGTLAGSCVNETSHCVWRPNCNGRCHRS